MSRTILGSVVSNGLVDLGVCQRRVPAALHAAIQGVLKGFIFVSPYLASKVLNSRHSGNSDQSETIQLQTQYRETLCFLAEGKTAKEIEVHLHLTPKTIEYQKYHIILKLNIQTSARSSLMRSRTALLQSNS